MIHVRDEGAGEPVVMIPGLGAAFSTLDELYAEAKGYRLLSVDLPRSGRSKQWAPSTPEGIAAELSSWLAKQGITEYRLFGHSFGALAALELTRLDSGKVRTLTLASAPALGIPSQMKAFFETPGAEMGVAFAFQTAQWRPVLRTYLQFLWGKPLRVTQAHVERYAEALKAEGFAAGFTEALRAVSGYRVPAEAVRATNVPVHVIWGERDPLVSVPYGEHLATSLTAKFTVLPDVGHCVPEEDPPRTWKGILHVKTTP